MSIPNLYWPIYQNLEREFNDLMFDIHIDDNQLNVYSSKISDLILRASIEIESISKELYKINGGIKTENIKYDEDAIKHLNTLWRLDKKIIIISSPNIFLSEEKRILKPFEKNESRTGTERLTFSWNNSYQNIKHDRANSLSFGSIKYLLESMSALYLLNIYYSDKEFVFDKISELENFDSTLNSTIFSIEYFIDYDYFDFHNQIAKVLNDREILNALKDNYLLKSVFEEETHLIYTNLVKECYYDQLELLKSQRPNISESEFSNFKTNFLSVSFDNIEKTFNNIKYKLVISK